MPDDGSVEPKHVALKVFLTINWMCLAEKNLHFVYIQEHIGMISFKKTPFLTTKVINTLRTGDAHLRF